MSYPPPPPPPPGPPLGGGAGRRTPWLLVTAVVVGVVLVVVLATLAVLLASGSDETDAEGARTSGPTSTASTPSDPSSTSSTGTPGPTATGTRAAGIDNRSVVGTWDGSYVCSQGPTAGRLEITPVPGSSSGVRATFRFGPTAENPDVASGAYRLEGTVTDGLLDLDAGDWIRQPDGYLTVDFQADVTSLQPRSLDGQVIGGGCTTFSFVRQ